MARSFLLEMRLDDQGVVRIGLSGDFDFEAWRAQRRTFLDGPLKDVDFQGRPSLINLRASNPPTEDWFDVFTRINKELTANGECTGRTAFVVDDDHHNKAAARFFTVMRHLPEYANGAVEIYHSVEEAYAWLTGKML